MASITQSIATSSKNMDNINKNMRELNERIQNQLCKEDVFQSHRESDRLVKHDDQEFDRKQLDDLIAEKRAVIDREYQESVRQLRDKYQIVL
eukprot:gene415-492_t